MERLEDVTYTSKYERAKGRVEELRAYYNHLITYVLVIGGLAALNYYNNEWRYTWFLWAAAGWGIGIASHTFKTFYGSVVFGKDWEERKIQEFMNKDKAPREPSNGETRWE